MKEYKKYVPTDSMRTNRLSLIEGGHTVTVQFEEYSVDYTNIKNPISYISSVSARSSETIIEFLIDGNHYDIKTGKITKIWE